MLPEFYPDGAWSEGPGYWTYLMSSLPLMYQAVEDNFGTDFNLTKAPGLEKTGYYLPATASAVGQNNFHVDSGTFVIDMLGERWACDIGPEDYNLPEIFGNYRTRYYRNRPEGHNVYVINPQDGGVGQNVEDTFAPVEKTVSSNRGAYSIINLFEPYSKYVTKARRGIKLEDDRRSAVVRDEFVPVTDDSSVYWFMHTQAEIKFAQ